MATAETNTGHPEMPLHASRLGGLAFRMQMDESVRDRIRTARGLRHAAYRSDCDLIRRAIDRSQTILHEKYGDLTQAGWGPRQRARFGYLTPSDWYEALLDAVVTSRTVWLDVGCGRDLAPENPVTARRLADRCRNLVGIDPSANIDDNAFVRERLKMPIEQHPPVPSYHLITLRMVAEHIAAPEDVVKRLVRLLLPGGRIVIYTVARCSPSALVAACTPLWAHHAAKRVLWRAEERDTFPTFYRMNSRAALRRLFGAQGLSEEAFVAVADCRSTGRFRRLQWLELSAWKLLSLIGVRYPERCFIAVYRHG